MGDVIDRAQAAEQAFLAGAVRRYERGAEWLPSAEECEECGDPIPEARRKAVPGCTRCIQCQQEFERRPR